MSPGSLMFSASMMLPGVWKKACSITPCSCLMLPGQLQDSSRETASEDRRFCGRLCCADISTRICEAITSISFTRSRRGGTRMVVSSTNSYRLREKSPLSARRLRLESQAAITRTSNIRGLPPFSLAGNPCVSASASLSPISSGSFSTSSKNSVPPIASSSLPADCCPSSSVPKNSASSSSSDALWHFTAISGAAARGLA